MIHIFQLFKVNDGYSARIHTSTTSPIVASVALREAADALGDSLYALQIDGESISGVQRGAKKSA